MRVRLSFDEPSLYAVPRKLEGGEQARGTRADDEYFDSFAACVDRDGTSPPAWKKRNYRTAARSIGPAALRVRSLIFSSAFTRLLRLSAR
jgi:hypothetical protein